MDGDACVSSQWVVGWWGRGCTWTGTRPSSTAHSTGTRRPLASPIVVTAAPGLPPWQHLTTHNVYESSAALPLC
jgi:hypothetical protein